MFKTHRYNELFHAGDDGSSPDSVDAANKSRLDGRF